VMPNTSREVWRRLGLGDPNGIEDVASAAHWGGLPAGSRVEKGDALFPRIYEDSE
jgi:methionyl-tRNA synthetase